MENKVDNISEHQKLIITNISGLSIYALGAAILGVIIRYSISTNYSLQTCLAITVSTICLMLGIYILFAFYFKKKYDIRIPYIYKNNRKLYIVLFMILILQYTYIYSFNDDTDLPTITLNELVEMNNFIDDEIYYLIFGSENCTYCHQMEPVYQEVNYNHSKANMYYVDLTYESKDDPRVKELNITAIPSLISYKNGIELDRIVGMASYDVVYDFITE